MEEYNEWNRFTMQLQLWVLCAIIEAQRRDWVVRRRGYKVEVLMPWVNANGKGVISFQPLQWPLWQLG